MQSRAAIRQKWKGALPMGILLAKRTKWVHLLHVSFAVVVLSLSAAAAAAEENTLDGFNRASGDFNHWMMQNAVTPVAKGYNFIIPKFLQARIEDVVLNLQRPRDIVNSLLQGKAERAGRHTAHLLLNTLFGFGGLFYVSHRALDDDSPETFNETLGVWGLPPGPYVQLPLVVPPFSAASPRTLTGAAVDVLMNPLFWIPGLTGTIVSGSTTVGGALNTLATLMPPPWGSDSEWQAFDELISERTPYPERKALFYENQMLDVED